MRQEQERELRDAIESGTAQYSSVDELPLPVIPYVSRLLSNLTVGDLFYLSLSM